MHEYITGLIKENAVFNIDEKLRALREKCVARGVPSLLDESLNELLLIGKLLKPKKILELGTSFGCSGIAMLTSFDGAFLHTVESREDTYNEAVKNFEDFGLSDRVKIYLGEAEEKIDEVGDGFDLVFMDCGKSKYKNLLPKIKNILNEGGVLFADNVLFRGYVTGEVKPPRRHNTIKKNLRTFLEEISRDGDFITTVSDVGDGVSISYKKR